MPSFDNPIFGKVQTTEYESAIDPRVAQLAPAERAVYERSFKHRQPHVGRMPLSAEDKKAQDKQWDEFMFALLSVNTMPLANYAAKPAAFPADRYSLQYLVTEDEELFDGTKPYELRDTSVVEPHSVRRIHLDAPYGLCIVYKHEGTMTIPGDGIYPGRGKFEAISTASFTVDLTKRVLVVDHLQGGDTNSTRASKEGKVARAVFERGEGKLRENAETALFEAVCQVAHRAGLRGVALRKASSNQWKNVRDAHAAGKPTPYERVSNIKHLRGFAAKDYYLIPV